VSYCRELDLNEFDQRGQAFHCHPVWKEFRDASKSAVCSMAREKQPRWLDIIGVRDGQDNIQLGVSGD
jgi:hypothetical protein